MKILGHISKIYVLFAFLVFISVMDVRIAHALDLENIKPLSELELLSDEAFNGQTDLIEETPNNDTFLKFQVRLPHNWEEVKAEQNKAALDQINDVPKGLLGKVVEYVSPPKNYLRSRFIVETINLPHEISARNWFENYVIKNRLSIEQVGLGNKDFIEALYVDVQGDTSYVVRIKAMINGGRMVLAKYLLPVELYEEEKGQQAQVLKSFGLMNFSSDNIEEQKVHSFIGQSFFNYPSSWFLNAPKVRSINRMSAMLLRYNEADLLMGQINIFLSSKTMGTTRSDELKHYREKFDIPNYEIDALIDKPEIAVNPEMSFGTTQVYSMKSQTSDLINYELWVSVLENDKYYYITSLLTPSRDEDFYNWARNTQTYKVVLKNMRYKDDDLDPYDFMNQ